MGWICCCASSTTGNYWIGIGWEAAGGSYSIGVFYWLRTRAYPPNGVMPTVTFGTVLSYQISFYQTSLPSSTEWGIRLNNTTKVWWLNVSGGYDNFTDLPIGSYTYQVVNATGYYAPIYKGVITINGANVSQLITFKQGYKVSIKEQGLPPGTKWYVNVSAQPGLNEGGWKLSSITQYTNFTEPNGSYTFSIGYPPRPYALDKNNSLLFSVSGSSIYKTIYFINTTYILLNQRIIFVKYTLNSTKISMPYFYNSINNYNSTWSFYVYQISISQYAKNIWVLGNTSWTFINISVPAIYFPSNMSLKLSTNLSYFQVIFLEPIVLETKPTISNSTHAQIIINYYPEYYYPGNYFDPPFSYYYTYLNGQEINSPVQQVTLGENVTITTQTLWGIQISSYSTQILEQTQFISIPINIAPVIIMNENTSYSVALQITNNSKTISAQYLMPNNQQTLYLPTGTYQFSFSYFSLNSTTASKTWQMTKTISGESYIILSGLTIAQINININDRAENLTAEISNTNISIINKENNIINQIISLNSNISGMNASLNKQLSTLLSTIKTDNSTLYNQTLKIINDIENSNTSIMNKLNTILTDVQNYNSSLYSQTLKILSAISGANSSLLKQVLNIYKDVNTTNSSTAKDYLNLLNAITNANNTIHNSLNIMLTDLQNYNSSIYNEVKASINDIENSNTSIMNKLTIILSTLTTDNQTVYNEELKIYSYIVNSNATLYNQIISVLNTVKTSNTTLFNKILSVLTAVNNANTTLYDKLVSILSTIINDNITLYNHIISLLTKLNEYNSSIYNQTLKILTTMSNYNSSLYSQTIKIISIIENSNSTSKNETMNIINMLKSDNATLFNQTVKIINEILSSNSTLFSKISNVLLNVKNSNITLYNKLLDILKNITNANATLYDELYRENITIGNIYSQVNNIISELNIVQNNIINDINMTRLNETAKILAIKDIIVSGLDSELGYILDFGKMQINGSNIMFSVFVKSTNGIIANLTTTKKIASALQVDYVSPTNVFVLESATSDVQAGSFLLTIYDLNSSNEQNIINGYAVIVAKSPPFNSGGISEIGAGIISYEQFSSQPSQSIIPNFNFNSLQGILSFFSWLGTNGVIGTILIILFIAILLDYSSRISKIKKLQKKKEVDELQKSVHNLKNAIKGGGNGKK